MLISFQMDLQNIINVRTDITFHLIPSLISTILTFM